MPETKRYPPRLHLWIPIALTSSLFCILLAPDPSPLLGWIAYTNYHRLHFTWHTIELLQRILITSLPLVALVSGIQTNRAANHTHAHVPLLLGKLTVTFTAIALLLFINFLLPVFDGGYTWHWRERFDSLSSLREIAEARTYTEPPRRPAHLAEALTHGPLSERPLRYRYSKRPPFPDPLPTTGDWQTLIPLINAHADFDYLAADLPDPVAVSLASQIIIACGKTDLPEFPAYILDTDTHHYEYAYAARPAIFADGHTALSPSSDFPATFAAHNAARAALHLPPQQQDVPP